MKSQVPYTILNETLIYLQARKHRWPVIPKSALRADAGGLYGLMVEGNTGIMLLGTSETGLPVKTEPGRLMDATDFGNAVRIDDVFGTINESKPVDFTGAGFSFVDDTDVESYFWRYIDQAITVAEPASLEEVSLPPGEAEKIQQLFLRLEGESETEPDSWSAFDELEQTIISFGAKTIELLSTLIETTNSYTNAFITLDILGAMDHAATYRERLDVALTMLKHGHPSIRHGAINALSSLRSKESIESLAHLIETDYSAINIRTAQRVLDLVQSLE